MYYLTYPAKDATLYSQTEYANTGLDAILELSKTLLPIIHNSRIIIQFNLQKIQQLITEGVIPVNRSFFLVLHTCKATEIPVSYAVVARPLSLAWDMGVGRKHMTPPDTQGASWRRANASTTWTGGAWSNTTGPAQTFDYETTDINMDVSSIVEAWLSGTANHGFIVKRTDADETSTVPHGRIEFFSKETNTVYSPTLRVAWDDSAYNDDMVTAIDTVDVNVTARNMAPSYRVGSKVRIRLSVRPHAFVKQFDTQFDTAPMRLALPANSQYSILDAYTDETVIGFGEYSKISCDIHGSYYDIWLDSFQPERYYKVQYRVKLGGQIKFYDNNQTFKVTR